MGELRRKKDTVRKMILLYCRKNHKEPLCADCEDLLDYAHKRADSCPYVANKTPCSRCPSPCYTPEKREQMRQTMRFAGPRMLLHHPIEAIRYIMRRGDRPRSPEGGAL